MASLLGALPERGHRRLRRILQQASRLGLGYLTLGQSGDALSGGEAQRLQLAAHLAGEVSGAALFLLDEPTRGLHADDVATLRVALDELIAQGHSVIAVEHDRDVIADADYVVDMGPGAGAQGGRVLYRGLPEGLVDCPDSATGAALRGS